MSRRASGGTLAAFLILAAIVGFAGGAYLGTQSGDGEPSAAPTAPIDPDNSDDNSDNDADENDNDPNDDENGDDTSSGAITLSFTESSVSPGSQVAYSGRIESGEEGVTLKLQRSINDGPWEDFPVTPRVTDANGEFSGTVASSREGENRFRLVGVNDESLASETATITIG
ncbi:hypothetical protein [Phytoactinopolyspora limicola]|uniref:hypothetical protein n=1 Tax=Phytoactinopolyspora limicola TaxID=2715536 RepID=UPI00140E3F23|nr:hypothetical protein [Phytoactinopolyspora limicola]